MDEKKVQFISKYDGYKIRGFDRFSNGVLKVSEEDAEVLRKTPGFGTEFWEDQKAPAVPQAAKQGVVTLADVKKREDGTYNFDRVSKENIVEIAKELGVEVDPDAKLTKEELVTLITPSLPKSE